MNGVKGGMKDRILSLFFSKRKQKENPDLQKKNNINNSNSNNQNEINLNNLNNKNNTEENISETKKTSLTENDSTIEHTIESTNQLQKTISITSASTLETPKEKIETQLSSPNNNKIDLIPQNIDFEEKVQNEETISEEDSLENEYIESILVDTIKQIIKDDLNELERIKFELEVLSQKEDDEVLTDEVEKLKAELEELLKKFEKLKDKYYLTQKNNELEKIDDDYLYSLLEEYKDEIKNNNLLDSLENEIDTINEYIGFIEQLISTEKETDELDEKIDEKLDKFEIRDEEFEKMKEEYENIEKIDSLIDDFNRKQYLILEDLEDKVKKSEEINKKIEKNIEFIPQMNKLITAALLIGLSKQIPPTFRGNLLKVALIGKAIHSAATFITTKETQKTVTTIKYTDFSKSILNAKESITSAISKIDNTFDEIDTIRENFKKECGDYEGKIPEYDELIANLDKIEEELKDKQKLIIKQHKQVNKILINNNEKVKRLEKMENSTAA